MSKSETASEDFMKDLHKMVAEGYVEGLKTDMSPAMLTSAANFLKSNNVSMVPASLDALEKAAEAFADREFEAPEDKKIMQFPVAKEA